MVFVREWVVKFRRIVFQHPGFWLRLFRALRCRRRSQVRRSLFHNIPARLFIYDFSRVGPRRCRQSVSSLPTGQRKRAMYLCCDGPDCCPSTSKARTDREPKTNSEEALRHPEEKSGPANARTNSQARDIPLLKPSHNSFSRGLRTTPNARTSPMLKGRKSPCANKRRTAPMPASPKASPPRTATPADEQAHRVR